MEFRPAVWAPKPKKLEIVIDGRRSTPVPVGGGWRRSEATLEPGQDYGFIVDGEGPFPDPRSPRQPHGVHGLSQSCDHDAFQWRHTSFRARPLASAVIYEAHVGTFTQEGTFTAMIDKLDHLVDLGVTHLELMPVAAFSGVRGWGYDGVSLFAPHEAYGGPDGLKRLVDACHGRDLAVILDVVYNHLGPEGNYLAKYGPYFTKKYRTPWGEAVNYDEPGCDEVRRFVCDNARMWLRDYRIDGLRLDAVHAIFDMSARHILQQLAEETAKLEAEVGRPLVLIAESDLNDPRIIRSIECGGYGLHAQWNDDFHHALHALLTGEQQGYYADFGSAADLAKSLNEAFVYDGAYSTFRGKRHGAKPVGLGDGKFVVCSQNHDQVGNRARGERLQHIAGTAAAKAAAALTLLSPYSPMLFQGEEWGASTPFQYFTDHQDDGLAKAVERGRKKEFAAFGWKPADIPNPQAEETFLRSKLRFEEIATESGRDMTQWYKLLIGLRTSHPTPVGSGPGGHDDHVDRGKAVAAWLEPDGLLILRRGRILAALNLAEQEAALPAEIADKMKLAATSFSTQEASPGSVMLPKFGVIILEEQD